MTIKNAYPISRIDESLSKLGDAKFFTTLDLGSALWQVLCGRRTEEGPDSHVSWAVPVEEDSLWLVQRHDDLSKCDVYVMFYVVDVVILTPTLADPID